uniref:Uncharacterized protein n=1 Tax=Timema genevievae TaxID=629358 RepID=A0A7R9K0M6_TIMGE|nr:unnamed protein product [Timema genevievae]
MRTRSTWAVQSGGGKPQLAEHRLESNLAGPDLEMSRSKQSAVSARVSGGGAFSFFSCARLHLFFPDRSRQLCQCCSKSFGVSPLVERSGRMVKQGERLVEKPGHANIYVPTSYQKSSSSSSHGKRSEHSTVHSQSLLETVRESSEAQGHPLDHSQVDDSILGVFRLCGSPASSSLLADKLSSDVFN